MKFCTVDTFTNELFKGNPVAVCVIDEFPDDDFMQSVAVEVNLSETAFVVPIRDNHFGIRWFTQQSEATLCGPATLAAAHVLWTELKSVTHGEIYFESKSGILKVTQSCAGEITLDFPAHQVTECAVPAGLQEALGGSTVFVGKANDDYVVELLSPEDVLSLEPDIRRLADIDCRGIIVTAEGNTELGYDFVSRFFAPRIGVPEDSVTGSAHCKLATYWSFRLKKNEFKAFQASHRGGWIGVRYEEEGERAFLTGKAVTAFSGKFLGLLNA